MIWSGTEWIPYQREMTIRDFFAAQAIHLFPMNEKEVEMLTSGRGTPLHATTAKFCYDLADAMLAERSRR